MTLLSSYASERLTITMGWILSWRPNCHPASPAEVIDLGDAASPRQVVLVTCVELGQAFRDRSTDFPIRDSKRMERFIFFVTLKLLNREFGPGEENTVDSIFARIPLARFDQCTTRGRAFPLFFFIAQEGQNAFSSSR